MRLCRFPFSQTIRMSGAARAGFIHLPTVGERLKRGRSGEISASCFGLPIPVLWPG